MSKSKLLSMTGFGRAAETTDGVQLEVEVRTVNSRYCDLQFRMPREYTVFESRLRSELGELFARGRIDVQVNRTVTAGSEAGVHIDPALFADYLSAYERAVAPLGLWNESFRRQAALELVSKRELLSETPPDASREEGLLFETVKQAAQNALEMRRKEGEALERDLRERLKSLSEIVRKVQQKEGDLLSGKEEALRSRIAQLLKDQEVDEARFAQEAAYLVDRFDLSEETTRLLSHIEQFEVNLQEHRIGRKLEFLLQEIGRELNTIASKAQHADVQQLAVDAKGEVERMREQAQNVE